MLPTKHLFFGIIFSLFLLILSPKIGLIGFFILLSSTVFIDVDHYLYYVYKKRDISLKRAHQWFSNRLKKIISLPKNKRDNFPGIICFLHGVEVLFITIILSFFISKYFFYVFMGFAFHLLLDSIDQTIYWNRIDKFSLIADFFKFKKLNLLEK